MTVAQLFDTFHDGTGAEGLKLFVYCVRETMTSEHVHRH
jgi:hypothetical protein